MAATMEQALEEARANFYWFSDVALHAKELEEARKQDPDGATCHFCGRPNTHVDDCGFYGIIDPREPEVRDERGFVRNRMYAACRPCYDEHGWKHVQLYGVGER